MITISGLTKKFGDFVALDNIDLTIPEGSAFGVLGSNGAGKSTLLRLMSGIYQQDKGKILIDGEEIFDNVKNKQKIFFINDETIQFSQFTIKELKDFYKGFYPDFSEDIFKSLCAKIKIPDNKKLSQFSKGMKRQAIVIIGLSCQTKYLFLDEAFDGLDPTMRIIVKHMIVDAMLDRNMTVIISSHNLKEINELCDSVALFHKGKIVVNRQLDEVKGNIHKIQLVFESELYREDFADLDVLHFEKQGRIIHIISKGEPDKIKAQLDEKNPLVIEMIPLTLEEIFIYEMEGLGYDCTEIN